MTHNNRIHQLLAAAGVAATFGGASIATAGDYGKVVIDDKAPIESAWTFCDLFDKKYFYKSDEGFVRSARFLGRYHGQYISQQEDVNDTLDNGYHRFQNRRFRLGFEVELANDLTFYIESNIADGVPLTKGDFITTHQDLFLEWEPSDDFLVRVGKQKLNVTSEDEESSKRIKTVERSPITNEVGDGRPYGAVFELQTGALRHEFGGWLWGVTDAEPRWVDARSDAGFSYFVDYEVNDNVTVHFDYVFNDNDGGNSRNAGVGRELGPEYEHTLAAGVLVEQGRFQLMSDVIYAANREGQGGGGGADAIPAGDDTWGFYMIPSYDITDKLQAVFRYAYMDSGREQRTARFPTRRNVENYHSLYAGFQYFVCGDKFKILGGYEKSFGDLRGTSTEIDTGSWQLAFRTYW